MWRALRGGCSSFLVLRDRLTGEYFSEYLCHRNPVIKICVDSLCYLTGVCAWDGAERSGEIRWCGVSI